MSPDQPSFLLTQLTAVITGSIAAWLTAMFALRRFYREKVWERKTAAYTAIFDALHDMRRWFKAEMKAYHHQVDITDEKLGHDYTEAQARLRRRLDAEMWLLPQTCLNRLKLFEDQLAANDDVDQADFNLALDIEDRLFYINSVIEDLRLLAQQDLGLTPSVWRESAKEALRSVHALRTKLPWKKL